jgi:hypothetical protein
MRSSVSEPRVVPPEVLAGIGAGRITYVKAMSSDEATSLFPQAPPLAPGLKLFALLGADGTPILLTDSREAAVASALQNDLVTVAVH